MVAIVLWMVVGWGRPCRAQSALFNGKGVLYGGIGAGYYRSRLGGEDTHSQRFVFMSSYGLARWMEVFAQAGAANLKIEGDSGRTDFRGEYKAAVGAGVRVRLLDLLGSSVLIYGEGSGTWFPSKGKVSQRTEAGTIQSTVEYDWWEGATALGVEVPSIGFYAGARAGGVEATADRHSYLIEGMNKTDIGSHRETYRSGTRWDGFVGKIFPLRGHFRLGVHVTGPEMASIRVDLMQLYQPEDDPF